MTLTEQFLDAASRYGTWAQENIRLSVHNADFPASADAYKENAILAATTAAKFVFMAHPSLRQG